MSNEVLESHRYKLSLNAQKLLYGLAQSLDHTIDMFNTIEVDIYGLFRFLNIEDRNDRYDIIRDSILEIQSNPLLIKYNEKKWKGISWITYSGFNEENSSNVEIRFTEEIKPYLLNLNGYIKIQGKYICSLSSAYATWLYPVMKMIIGKYKGKRVITIQRLKEYTFTENPKEHTAYSGTYGTKNFLQRVIGAKKNTKTRRYEVIKNSPLWEINEKTDITVSVEVLKTGRKYDRICFYVQSKSKNKGSSNIDKSKFVNEIPKTTGLNPISRIPLKDVYEYAKSSKMNVHDYCEKSGYYIKGQYVYKKFKQPNQGKKRTAQMNINDLIEKNYK